MIQIEIPINHPTGLHARPAAQFVNAAKAFSARIAVRHDGREADAKSILSIMALGLKNQCTVTILADGPDENDAINRLKALIESNFAEG